MIITPENNIKESCLVDAVKSAFPDFRIQDANPEKKYERLQYYFKAPEDLAKKISDLNLSIKYFDMKLVSTLSYSKEKLHDIHFGLKYSGSSFSELSEDEQNKIAELVKSYVFAFKTLPSKLQEICGLKNDPDISLKCRGDLCKKMPEDLLLFK